MKDNIFDPSSIEKIVEKIKKDKSGRMTKALREIMEVSEKAGKVGFDLRELSINATTGRYLSQNPQLKQLLTN